MAETGEPWDSGGNGRVARWHGRSAARSTRREVKASDAMILGGEDSVAAGQMNGGGGLYLCPTEAPGSALLQDRRRLFKHPVRAFFPFDRRTRCYSF